MPTPVVPELRLALFGQKESGKTSFFASYYGNQQRPSFQQDHGYRLLAEDLADGNRLLSRYYAMEAGTFPLSTEAFAQHSFEFKVSGLDAPSLRIVWYDYPGEWWTEMPKDDSEREKRREAIRKLLASHLCILLVDAQAYRALGHPYINNLLASFRQALASIPHIWSGASVEGLDGKDFSSASAPDASLPQWLIAISKSDLLPTGTTAETVCKDIVVGAAEELRGLATILRASAFGHQFLLLSAAKGEGKRVLDAHSYIGLPLVAPIALISTLDDLAKRSNQGTSYGVAQEVLRRLSKLVDFIDRLDDFLPPKYGSVEFQVG